jgi:hypothetical protein
MSTAQSKVITVRMSREQFDYITKQSSQAGMSKNEFCLSCLIGETDNDSIVARYDKVINLLEEIYDDVLLLEIEDEKWRGKTSYINELADRALAILKPKGANDGETKGVYPSEEAEAWIKANYQNGNTFEDGFQFWAAFAAKFKIVGTRMGRTSIVRDQPVPDSVPVENEGR